MRGWMRAGKRVRAVLGEVLRHWEPGAGVAVRGVARNGPAIGCTTVRLSEEASLCQAEHESR